jgi:predicted DsbA family dithiol-disulfide isomerase
MSAGRSPVQLEVFLDVVCPWCWIGHARLERALGAMGDGERVQVHLRPFRLDPQAPARDGPRLRPYLEAKYGGRPAVDGMLARVREAAAAEGLDYRPELDPVRVNTLDAHRLIWLARAAGAEARVLDRLYRAYFTEGLDLGDREVLARLAGEAGLDAARARAALEAGEGASEVLSEMEIGVAMGVSAVPTFVADRRWGLQGAQDPEVIREFLAEASARNG